MRPPSLRIYLIKIILYEIKGKLGGYFTEDEFSKQVRWLEDGKIFFHKRKSNKERALGMLLCHAGLVMHIRKFFIGLHSQPKFRDFNHIIIF